MDKRIKTEANFTCPKCNHTEDVEMPTNACQHFYSAPAVMRPSIDCCVFCSYADSKCPPEQNAELETQTNS